MDEMDPGDLKVPVYLLRVFRAAQVMGEDLERATEDMLEIMDYVQGLKESQQDDD